RRQAFAERLKLTDAGSDPDESAAIAEIAALVPECAALDLRFALEPDGRRTMETIEELLDALNGYRAARAGLAAEYPDDRIASAPLQVWMAAKTSAESKIWPLRLLARRKLRKVIWQGLEISADVASEPEHDL